MQGYLVIGDVHAVYEPFAKAVQYAADHDLKLISLGDLCDQNDQGPEVFALMAVLMNSDSAFGIKGNHEWKIERYRAGRPVRISTGNQITVEQMAENPAFGTDFDAVVDRMTDYIEIGDAVLAHGGVPRRWWDNDITAKRARDTFYYGETDNTFVCLGEKKYPNRTYGWCDCVPAGRTVIVGHDTKAMLPALNKDGTAFAPPRDTPYVYVNKQRGRVIFADTGCGKSGTLTGLILDQNGEYLDWENFGG